MASGANPSPTTRSVRVSPSPVIVTDEPIAAPSSRALVGASTTSVGERGTPPSVSTIGTPSPTGA
ncbi:MAG: hypothetical protein H0W01_11305 [Pseudonocardiales bacterium]|nr:hypothetical protein [Pseudonocardiales bacterium]